jgi:hypothetical protein
MRATILIMLAVLAGCGKTETVTEIKEVPKPFPVPVDLKPEEKQVIVDYYNGLLANRSNELKKVLASWNTFRDATNESPESRTLAAQYLVVYNSGLKVFRAYDDATQSSMIMYKERLRLLDIDDSLIVAPPAISYGKAFQETADKVKAKFKL